METQNQNTDKMKAARKAGRLLIIGCTFFGTAVGWYFDRMFIKFGIFIGLFAGMGIGFILMAVVIASQANKR